MQENALGALLCILGLRSTDTMPPLNEAKQMAGSMIEGPFLVDAHVHYHVQFAERDFLGEACRGYVDAMRQLGVSSPLTKWGVARCPAAG